jgi:propanol-preferring alcohol dehydrogenase
MPLLTRPAASRPSIFVVMRALVLHRPNPATAHAAPLEPADLDDPTPADGELLVRVSVCAVCRTDLDIVEGRVVAPRYPLIPGHQVVGRVVAAGRTRTNIREGERVGIAWIHSACGICRRCQAGEENLCPKFRSTGCDADGGYAELITAPAAFVHAIPEELSDQRAAPLLCAGAIGWRSLRLTNLHDGEPLGLAGFGASAHLVLQLAQHRYPGSPVFVFARSANERDFARELGAAWAGDFGDGPPEPMGAIIDTTPVWKPVVATLPHLAPGGRFVINAIRKVRGDQQELLRLGYATHLWMEREIKTVANVTRADVREMLEAAVAIGLRPTVDEVPLERVNEVLAKLRTGVSIRGATVLRVAAS